MCVQTDAKRIVSGVTRQPAPVAREQPGLYIVRRNVRALVGQRFGDFHLE
jgi:hypothetical protein